MNIHNIGIDIIENDKISQIGIDKISQRILSAEEKKIFQKINNDHQKIIFLSGRWAIKEAIFKTQLTEITKNINFNEYTILNNHKGAPYIKNIIPKHKIMVSISHSKNYTVALAILIKL